MKEKFDCERRTHQSIYNASLVREEHFHKFIDICHETELL